MPSLVRTRGPLAGLALGACAPAPQTVAETADTAASSGLRSARYTLAWDTTGVEADPDGGWVTTSDLGYRVHVTGGGLRTFSAALSRCVEPSAAARRADHSGLTLDETVAGPVDEALDAFAPSTLEVSFAPSEACGVTWVVGPSPDQEEDHTLWLEGSWTLGERASGALAVETRIAWSQALPWTELEDGHALRATLTRDPSRLFDGVALETATGGADWVQLLANLGQHTTLTAVAAAP